MRIKPLQPGLLALALLLSPLKAASAEEWGQPLAGLPGAGGSLPAPGEFEVEPYAD